MDRRNFLRMSGTKSAKAAAGLAIGLTASESIIEKCLSSVSEELSSLKEKFTLHSEQIKQSTDTLELEMARIAHEISHTVRTKYSSLDNRITTIQMHQMIILLWLTALTLLTGLDFVSTATSLVVRVA